MTVVNKSTDEVQRDAEWRYHTDAEFHARVYAAIKVAQLTAPTSIADQSLGIEYGVMIGMYLGDLGVDLIYGETPPAPPPKMPPPPEIKVLRCPRHPRYKARRKPRETIKHLHGCVCWQMWRAVKP